MTAESLAQHGWQQVDVLGIGARGSVLLVRPANALDSPRDGSQFALKRSTADEVRALKALAGCRHVVGLVQDHYFAAKEVWARLEWLAGGSLRGLLRQQGGRQLSELTVRSLLSEVLAGLEGMHGRGWMHRDVKAENIGLVAPWQEESATVKLLDLDVAVQLPPRGQLLTEVVGTLENMAPEVYEAAYDERADCWSCGVVAFEMLFGFRPFNDSSAERIEETVRSWQRYLLFPYDAREESKAFVEALLTGRRQRLSSGGALRHPWLRGAPACSFPGTVPAAPCFSAAPVPAPTLPRPVLPEPLVAVPSSPSRAARRPKGEAEDGQVLESLASLRRSLSAWNRSQLEGFCAAPCCCADSEPAALPGEPTLVALAAPRRQLSSGSSGAPPAFSESSSRSTGSKSEPSAGDDHEAYLQQVRSRTQEILRRASSALSEPEQPRAAPEAAVGAAESAGTAEMRAPAAAESAPRAELRAEPLAELGDLKQRTQMLLRKLSEASEAGAASETRSRAGSPSQASVPAPDGDAATLPRQASHHGSPPPSPRSWLELQKLHTSQLLCAFQQRVAECC